jgi:hypothetical protein
LTIADVVAELNNWRRWRWAGMPNLDVPEPPAFELYSSGDYEKAAVTEGHELEGRYDNAPDPGPPEIDEPAAEAMHSLLWEAHMSPYRGVIYAHWHFGERVRRDKLEAAHVAIMDTLNRWSGDMGMVA